MIRSSKHTTVWRTAFAISLMTLGSGIVNFSNAYADDSSVTITVRDPLSQNNTLRPSKTNKAFASYTIPVDITVAENLKFSVYVYGDENLVGEVDSNNKIFSLSSDLMDETIFKKQISAWGYRSYFGLSTDNPVISGDYRKVKPAINKDKVSGEDDIAVNDGSVYNGKLTLEFAANVDYDSVENDNYQGNVTVSVVAEALQAANFFNIKNMQEMTHDVCFDPDLKIPAANANGGYASSMEEVAVGNNNVIPQTRLKDTRDNKEYVVRKLADGNCWMASNLNYTPATDTVLTDEKTDFTESTTKSWKVTAGSIHEGVGTYYAGNSYYTWAAATAGAGAGADIAAGARADRSICPRGWRLPTGGAAETAFGADGLRNGDYQRLITAGSISNNTAGSSRLQNAPFGFSLAGRYDSNFVDAGTGGSYWSSTSQSASSAYYMYIFSSWIDPQGYVDRGSSCPVRCVAR